MKTTYICIFLIFLITVARVANAGSGTGSFKIDRITVYGDTGAFKIYTDRPSINGMEGCKQMDNSIAVPGNPGSDKTLSLALSAKVANLQVGAWVVGCCLVHNGKTSPCVSTLTIK